MGSQLRSGQEHMHHLHCHLAEVAVVTDILS